MSAIQEASLFGRGETAGVSAVTDLVEMEGYEKWFPDLDWSVRGVKPRRSNRMVLCRIVRNTSGVALLPKLLCAIELTAGQGRCRTNGYARTTAARGYPIDEFLPAAGVANNDLFWVIVRGPAMLKTSVSNMGADLAVGDMMCVQTAAASTHSTTAGRVVDLALGTAANTTGQALFDRARNAVGYALSALTTTGTDANILVDVNLLN